MVSNTIILILSKEIQLAYIQKKAVWFILLLKSKWLLLSDYSTSMFRLRTHSVTHVFARLKLTMLTISICSTAKPILQIAFHLMQMIKIQYTEVDNKDFNIWLVAF